MEITQAGRYEVREVLGRGGAGSVYSGWDPLIGRRVAVKIMPLGEVSGQDAMKWILREAQAAGVLSHPHIVTVFDIGTEQGNAYIVMEMVEGGSLANWIRDDRLKPEDRLRILTQVASALDEAHRNGITHRDVKPANVLLKDDGTAKIGDFGIARIHNAAKLTKTGHFVGTPQYMSPEQLQGKDVDGRADQFSLAMMAYELYAGRPPFTGEGLIYQLLTAEPPAFDSRLDPVLRKGMAKKAADRFTSCTELVDQLRSALEAAPAPVAPPAALKWKFAATLAGVFLFVGAAGYGAWALLNSAQKRAEREAVRPPVSTQTSPPVPAAPVEEAKKEPEPEKPAVVRTERVQTPAPKQVEAPAPSPPKAEPAGASLGSAVWEGKLKPGEVLTIEEGRCSTGLVTRELPGSPVSVTITPQYVKVVEAPSEENGWKRIRLSAERETETIVISFRNRS